MEILSLIYAVITSTIYILLYINLYDKYFKRRKTFVFGVIFFLLAIYIQFVTIYLELNIGFIGLLSFISYPIAIFLIFETNVLHNIFLSLNAILKIYAAYILFGAIFALYNNVQYSATWLNTTHYFNLAQGFAYLLSIGSLLLNDKFLIKEKLKYFFELKGYLILLIFIQIILISNLVWISVSNVAIPYQWYNNILIVVSFSFDIIYFLLRLFTANSSYYLTFKGHTNTLKKQLNFQLDHYKTYESQMTSFLKYKHDHDKVLKGIANLLASGDIDGVKSVLSDSKVDLDKLGLNYRKYSNNIILDALLNDYKRRFKSIGSVFDCYIHFPIKDIKELHLIKLFYNILENIYEALLLVPDVNDRVVNIKTSLANNYIKIEFVNTMIKKDYTGKTSKKDKISHGFGIQIIDEIINTYNGFSNRFSLDENSNTYYHFELFLPIN